MSVDANLCKEEPVGEVQPGTHFLWVLKYKGNYKDICEKLGQDVYADMVKAREVRLLLSTPDLPGQMRTQEGKKLMQGIVGELQNFEAKASPSPVQQQLRSICEKMGYPEHTCRPEWASGAHVFVNAIVAHVLEDTFDPGELRNEHMVVSPELRSIVEEAMMQGSKNPKLGGETLRSVQPIATLVDTVVGIPINPATHELLKELPEAFEMLEADSVFVQARLVKVGQCPSLVSRKTHTTGEQPRTLAVAVKTWQRRRKNFTLWGLTTDLRISMPSPHDEGVYGKRVNVENQTGDSECRTEHNHDHDNNHHSEDDGDIRSRTLTNWTLLLAKLLDATHGKLLESLIDECGELEEQLTTKSFFTTFDDVSQEQLETVLEEIVDTASLLLEAPLVKSEHQFALAIEQRMADFMGKVATLLITEYPIEHVLASNEEDSKPSVKKALKTLQTVASMCWHEDVLQKYLAGDSITKSECSSDGSRSLEGWRRAFCDTVPLVAQDVSALVVPLFKAEMRAMLKDLHRICAMQSEGAHAIADELKNGVLHGMSKALSNMDLGDIARRKWREQKDNREQSFKPQKSPGFQLGEGTRVGIAIDHQAVHGGVGVALAGTPGVSAEYLMRKVPFKHKLRPGKSAWRNAKEAKRVMFED